VSFETDCRRRPSRSASPAWSLHCAPIST